MQAQELGTQRNEKIYSESQSARLELAVMMLLVQVQVSERTSDLIDGDAAIRTK